MTPPTHLPTWLFVCEGGDSSCAYYRALIPVMGLRQRGYAADLCTTIYQRDDRRWTGLVERGGRVFLIDPPPDVLVVRRLNGPDDRIMRNGWHDHWERGQHVFVDLDDDPWNLPSHNPAHGTMTEAELAGWGEDMATASLVIASTDALAESVRAHTDAPAKVCRNGIDPRIYGNLRGREEHTPLRLGWAGTTNFRGRDLAMIVPALREVLHGMGDAVEFWHLGHDDRQPHVNTILGDDFPVRVRTWPWVPITQLPYSLGQVDVGIVPMEPSLFNEARSNVTGLAMMAAGVPLVASATGEYARLGVPLARTHDDWVSELERMLTDQKHRRYWRGHGRNEASRHNPATTAKQYERLIGLGSL